MQNRTNTPHYRSYLNPTSPIHEPKSNLQSIIMGEYKPKSRPEPRSSFSPAFSPRSPPVSTPSRYIHSPLSSTWSSPPPTTPNPSTTGIFPILRLPLELRLMIYPHCTGLTLLRLSTMCYVIHEEIYSGIIKIHKGRNRSLPYVGMSKRGNWEFCRERRCWMVLLGILPGRATWWRVQRLGWYYGGF
ncbi:hypothetical protein BJ508DRAFT_328338 [Ascobolus immersus RN42]|uniref:F-box domain-containing protein n=1 Tax=Ascobolus immersus RN42 TaxID=1160509 RepID=A0A3N4I0E5_ASCIM|nr:hypothetical protein BJ508DRAFT_328338 [Ascobolus immersus RN42]